MCTLKELQEFYSINDLADMHEAIDMRNHVQQKSMDEAKSENNEPKVIKIDGSK